MDSMSRELEQAKGFQHLKSQVMSLVNELQEAEKKCEDKQQSLKIEKDRYNNDRLTYEKNWLKIYIFWLQSLS